MRYFLYRKKGREVLPVEDKGSNKLAKEKLESFYQQKEQLKIPKRFINERSTNE